MTNRKKILLGLMALFLVTLGLTIFVGAMIIICNLVVDIIYAFVDPRVKIDK